MTLEHLYSINRSTIKKRIIKNIFYFFWQTNKNCLCFINQLIFVRLSAFNGFNTITLYIVIHISCQLLFFNKNKCWYLIFNSSICSFLYLSHKIILKFPFWLFSSLKTISRDTVFITLHFITLHYNILLSSIFVSFQSKKCLCNFRCKNWD